MDGSEVGLRHSVAFKNLQIHHSVDLSPSVVSIAREIRISIIAIVLGITAVTIVNRIVPRRRSSP